MIGPVSNYDTAVTIAVLDRFTFDIRNPFQANGIHGIDIRKFVKHFLNSTTDTQIGLLNTILV